MKSKKVFKIILLSVAAFLLLNALYVSYEKIQCRRMIDAIENNDINKLESILKISNPNCVPGVGVIDAFSENIDKQTPLGAACDKGNFEMVKLLVEDGADVNYMPLNACTSPLNLATQSAGVDNLKIVKFLLENGAYINNSNLKTMYPAQRMLDGSNLPPNGMEILEVLLKSGEDSDNEGILHTACYWKHEEVIRYLVEEWGYDASDPYYLCAYCYGIDKYSCETLEYFLERGANPYEKYLANEFKGEKCAIEYLQEESPEWAEKLIDLAASYGITE
ncbi:MAG: ankyrin repeat domain-containing protein [Oscillospiraceae bacterium]|nr:ankyrin repeat domain-containing protein [Oscillospiraceae bacterium]